ncbi:hypothetical protein GOP47_0010066 [Adiantum capillus-veneris]|uniref:Uncharacterized protein n=1 Tax=Adiantum capillus-veneris TaxID=13818 RepID=A0A9D4UUR5_ADICA|nr:hypothetical protein GOP47_0010066 [Adiantum capillus-veneris]
MAAPAPDHAPPTSSDQQELDAKASRLVNAAQRASEVAKRAYAAGIETTQVRMRQVSDVVLENAQRAKGSSKDFLSKVYVKGGDYAGKAQERAGYYAGKAQERAGHYTGKAQERALVYKDNVSRAIQQSRDGEGEKLGFPLSIMVWCSTLCGGSKKKMDDSAAPREMEAAETESSMTDQTEEGEQFSSEFLASTADEYAAALEEAAKKLEEAVADKEKSDAVVTA